jgi:hypothetical protein
MLYFEALSSTSGHQVERRSPRGRWQVGLLLALMLSVSLTACGTEQSRDRQAPTQTPQTSDDTLPQASDGRLPHVLSDSFALLRTPPDGIPPRVKQVLSDPIPGMSWSLARRVPVSATSAYWLVPGVENLCVVATTPKSPTIGTVCASTGEALRHGIANTSLDPTSGRRIIVGVVPKGTRTVIVRSGNLTASVRVRHGHFVLRDSVSSPPDRMTLR